MAYTNSSKNNIRMQYSTVEGNVVRKEQLKIEPSGRLKSSAQILKRSKALKKQRRHFAILGSMAVLVIVALSIVLLKTLSYNGILIEEVNKQEVEVEHLIMGNDAREYDINSSVDLNYVIDVATNELGMVRSNVSQIVTYSMKNSEYLQQVAKVPVE